MTGLEDIAETIAMISRNACSVLVLGETGTGKEIIARKIHDDSNRRDKPFIAVNTGGVGQELLASELFGHSKGAYTGAHGARDGQFLQAEGGTIFLDEIGELEIPSQIKLLRVLQNGEYFPIGSDKPKKSDARVIAATNVNIPNAVSEKRLRGDLLQRFKLRIKIPSLRERGDEAMRKLAENFVFTFSSGRKALSKEAMEWLCNKEQSWPGNVRQLETVIEMACLLTPNQEIRPSDLIMGYHDDDKFSRFEESLTCVDEGEGNDEIIRLAKRIYLEGGINEFRRNLMTTISAPIKIPDQSVEALNLNGGAKGPTDDISPVPLVNESGVIFQGDKKRFTEEKRSEIVSCILQVFHMKKSETYSLESRVEVIKLLVKTLETGQLLSYSIVQSVTGFTQPARWYFFDSLRNIIEKKLDFKFYSESSGVRLIPKQGVGGTYSEGQDESVLLSQWNQGTFTKEMQDGIVPLVLEVYRMKENEKCPLTFATEVIRQLVETLETGQLLPYSRVQSVTGLEVQEMWKFFKNLEDGISQKLDFELCRERFGVRLVPKNKGAL